MTIASSSKTFAFDALSIDSSSKLDLGKNNLIIHNGSLSSITALVHTGYNGGAWNGVGGIDDSAATNAFGIEQGSNYSLATFGGQPVVGTDVLVKYTYFGDANLDGVVNGDDYTLIDNGYNTGASGWFNGDFNYDGVINSADYQLIDNAFNLGGAPLAAAGPAEMIASDTGQVASSVPEPGSLGLVVVGAVGFMRRRSRRA